MIMGKKVWAVVCGAIRYDFELYATLSMLCDYRAENLIEGIVISTWKGEVDNISGLRAKLNELDIYVVELDPLDENIDKYEYIVYVRQAYQLKEGLDFIPDDVFVLRCRTDYSEDKIKVFKNILLGDIDMSLGTHGDLYIPLHYRIGVIRFCITIPFGLLDSGFVAYKDDMYKMVNFEMTSLRYGVPKLRADIAFFMNIFVNEYPIIGEYLTSVSKFFDGELLFAGIRNQAAQNNDEPYVFNLPNMMDKFFALYFLLLKTSFYLIQSVNEEIKPFDIIDCFVGNEETGIYKGGFCTTQFVNVEILNMITENRCLPTFEYKKLYNQISQMAYKGYAQSVHLTNEDYNEMHLWIKNILCINPKKVLRRKKIQEEPRKNDTDFYGAADIFFSDYKIKQAQKDNFFKTLYDICFDKTIGFYGAIVNNINQIQRYDSSLFDAALMPASRSERPEILKTIAKKLYAYQIAPEKVETAEFIFLKWGANPKHFYKFPMHSDKIAAFYWFGKYSEQHGNNSLSRTFFNQLTTTFGVKMPTPASYADGVLDAIKMIVNSNYKNYAKNSSIAFMIDFLVDEIGEKVFSNEQWSYLSEYINFHRYALPFQKGEKCAYEYLLDSFDKSDSEEEKKFIIRLLLREKWQQPQADQDRADDILTRVPETIFIKANFQKEITDLSEIKNDDDFILLCRILSNKKSLKKNYDLILSNVNSCFRQLVMELFLKLEENTLVTFFSVKKGRELWMYYSDFKELPVNDSFLIPKNKNEIQWPQADAASPSPLAAFVKIADQSIFLSVEFNSCKCCAKEKLFSAVDCKSFGQYCCDTGLIRIFTKKYDFVQQCEISVALEQALDDFCKYGNMFTKAADKAEKGEIV